MASIPTNTARTAPLDTSVKLGAAQQRALKDLVAMGFGQASIVHRPWPGPLKTYPRAFEKKRDRFCETTLGR